MPADDTRPWSAAAAEMLAEWPTLAEPLVDALATGRPVDAAVERITAGLAERMTRAAQMSARLTIDDAASQGVDSATGEPDSDRIGRLAATFAGVIASGYASTALQATLGFPLAEAGRLRGAVDAITDAVRTALTALGAAMSGLVPTQVGAAIAAAEHEGMTSVYRAHPPRHLVATETHEDGNRCLPCEEVNGRRYDTLTEALEDYPTVGYKQCLGGGNGIRCRGHLRGIWGEGSDPFAPTVLAEADGVPVRTGAMLALVPTADDAARLAVDGGEDPGELHLTLAYLGKADEIDAATRQQLLADLTAAVNGMPVVEGAAFAPAVFNPLGDEPCRVIVVGGDWLDGVHHFLMDVLNLPPAVDRHAPWVPHVTLAQDGDFARLSELAERMGPVSFDRVRLAFAGQYVDIPLLEAGYDPEEDSEPLDGDWSLAEAEEDRNNLRTYFTADPEGLERWAAKKHPWTALFRILRKHLDPERAKRVTSAWYLRVFHHAPNQKMAEVESPALPPAAADTPQVAGRVLLAEPGQIFTA